MRRSFNKNNTPYVKPITKIQLSADKTVLRAVIVIISLIVGAVFIAYAVKSMGEASVGFTEIEVDSTAALSYADEMTLTYNLGHTDMNPTAEKKALVTLYSKFQKEAYTAFTTEVKNINDKPNTEITVSDFLYEAL